MSISKSDFGINKSGDKVTKYTLKNKNGIEVSFIDIGAVITNILVPDKDGVFEDIALGYDNPAQYEVNLPSFGAPIGRYANRISNAKFMLNGKEYKLDANEDINCLHSGNLRYNCCMYDVECEEEEFGDKISFTRFSPDGEQGFPGNLTLTITYTLNDDDELIISYYAVCDEDTIVNLTNHSYFNLGKGGHRCPDVLNQEVQIEADCYTPVNELLVPSGEIKELADTALDFREFKKLKDGLGKADAQGNTVTEYDYNFVFRNYNENKEVRMVAQFRDTTTGRLLQVLTDQPGMQLYTAGTFDEDGCKDGMHYKNFCGACFESQNFPNAINTAGFPNAVLKAGDEYKSTTVFRFKTL